ncbi:MAG: PP2C family protein-serine/threonine phosphatase [Lachnospiraceae bacterium]|nr:PP2C family protein-serine/threonine phosphatase [Lachnospiraceae bacterium]
MKRGFKKLGHTMVFYCSVLALVLCFVLGGLGYFLYYSETMENYTMYIESLLNIANSQVDADDMAACIALLEESDIYSQTQKELNAIRSDTIAEYVYIVVPLDEDDIYDVIYVCDAYTEQEVLEEPDTLVNLGDSVEDEAFTDDVLELFNDIMFHGAETSYISYHDGYGYTLTGVKPVTDSAGNVICLVCIDISMDDVEDAIYIYFVGVFSGTAVILVIMLLIIVSRLNRSVVRPVCRMAEAAGNFVEQSHAVADPSALEWHAADVDCRNEIGMLNESITNMMSDTVDYMKNLAHVTAEKERIGTELDIAAHIQASMLPCIFPAFPEREEFEIFASMNPAKEVGGDFYDFFMVDNTHIAFVMADVSGKGVPAALFMVIGKTLIKDHTLPGRDLGEVFTRVNNLLCEANSEEMFITAYEGVLDLETGELDFVNAGHEAPFICKKDGSFEPYKIRHGFVLAGMEGMRYVSGSTVLDVGDRIFQYTDGVIEATNGAQELYGKKRLEETLNRCRDLPSTELLKEVKADVDRFVGEEPQFDDITMLCLDFKGKMKGKKG